MEFRVAAAVLTLCLIKIRQSSGHGPAFLIHDKSQSWYDAYLACQRSHLSLVIPTHLDLQDLYERLPKDVCNVWLGGRKVHTDWRWVDGGQDPVTDLGCILQSELPANARVITEEHPFTCLGSCSTEFAAMQGNKCTCLESPPLVYVSDSMCNFLCSANFDQFCGGKQTATLYRMQSTFIPWDSTQYLNKDCAYLHAYGLSVHLRTDDCEGPSVLYKQALCQHCSSGGDNCSVTRSDSYMLWSQAREYCSNRGQQLLTVRDNRTLPRMQEWTEERYWIGLKRESRLKWINGSAIDDAIVITSKDGFCVMARRMDGFIAVETIDCSTRLPVACHSGIKGTNLTKSYSSTSITSKIENFTNISHTTLRNEAPAVNKPEAASTSLISQKEPLTHVLQSTGIINQREFQSSSHPTILPSSKELQETKETEAASISFNVNAAPNSTKVDVSEGQPNTTDSVSGITSHFTSRLDTTQDTSEWNRTTVDDRNSSPQTADLNSYTSSTDSLPNGSTKVDVSEGQPNTPDSVSGITSHFTSRLDTTQDTSKWMWTTEDDRNSSPQTADLNSYTSSTDSLPNGSTKVDVSEGQPNTPDSVSGITSHFTSRLDTTQDTSKWIWTTADDRNSSPQTADLNSYTSSTDSPPNGSTKVDVSEGQPNTPDSVSEITSHFTFRLDMTQVTSKLIWTTADDRNSSPQTADLNSYTSSTDSLPNGSTKVDVSEGQPNTPDSVSGITSHFTSRLDTTQDTSKWIWTTADDRNSSPQTADLNSYTSSTDSPPNGSTTVNVSEGQPNTPDSVSGITSHFTSRLDTTQDTSEWNRTTVDDRNSSPQTADLNSYTSSTDSLPNGSTKVDVSEGHPNTPDSVSGITSHFTSRLDTTQDTNEWIWTTVDDRNSSPQTADLNSYTSSTDSPPNGSTTVDVSEGQPNTPDSVSGITSHFTSRLDTTQDTSEWNRTTVDDRNSSPQTADLNSYTSSTDSLPNGSTKVDVSEGQPNTPDSVSAITSHFTSRLDTTQDTNEWIWTTVDDRNSSPQTADLNSYASSTDSPPNGSTKVDVSEGQPNTPDSVSGITSQFTSRLDTTQDTSKWIWTTADDRNSSPQTADLNSYTSSTDSPPNGTKKTVGSSEPDWTKMTTPVANHRMEPTDLTPLYITLGVLGGLAFIALFVAIFIRKYRARRNTMDMNLLEKGSVPSSSPGCSYFRESLSSD